MALSNPSGIAKMIVQYEWILENVEKEPKTFASKMILFRGERVFRVGLKNHVEKPVLFLMAGGLNKIGMKVEGVISGVQGSGIGPAMMMQMAKENIGDEGSLQLFTAYLIKQVVSKCTFLFRICIEGSVSGYSYQLSDRLANDQLWAAAKNKNGVDVEFTVKDKTFPAHKAILAARSPVFEAEFTKEQPVVGAVGLHQIRIDGVEPPTVEQFLHFIYTGEPMGTLANEELLKLADKYGLTTLSNLCQVALKKIKPMQMIILFKNLHEDAEKSSSNIRPEKDTEIFFDRTTSTFRCSLSLEKYPAGNEKYPAGNEKSKCVMKYQNEDIFFAYISGKMLKDSNYINEPVIHFSCAQHRNCGLTVEDIYCSNNSNDSFQKRKWYKMESKNLQKKSEVLLFTTQPKGFSYTKTTFLNTEIYFDIKVISTVGNYYYDMMDDAWMKDFWFAAINKKLTDIEIFVGTVKVMEAHRIILSARSPVLNASFNKSTRTVVTFGAEFDVTVVEIFLKFLYTGLLETSASHKQLLKLATMYEVKTLKNMCQLANDVLDVEDFMNSLLEL